MPFLHFEPMDVAWTYCFMIFAWILGESTLRGGQKYCHIVLFSMGVHV
jgi:hypothetical protein